VANASLEPEVLPGTLVLVVGPSGAGKDTLIQEAAAMLAAEDFHFPVRSITRSAGGPEAHDPVGMGDFRRAVDGGGFLLHWDAHGLRYGVPADARRHLAGGRTVVVNVSRAVVQEACVRFPRSLVIHVTAPADVLAERLRRRGREREADIASRLARRDLPLPAGVRVVSIDNGADLGTANQAFLAALRNACQSPSAPEGRVSR